MEPNWQNDISQEDSIHPINWAAFQDYAINIKRSQNPSLANTCHIPPTYNKGGLHLVRLLVFNDDTKWIACIQLRECTPNSKERLLHEVHTLSIVRERTDIPVPEVFGYEASGETIGRAFMLMEFVPGNTGMDSFGGWHAHHGEIPAQFKGVFSRDIARIQAAMASIRFPKIGMITKRADGAYDIDPIPGLGGPFETAADYFHAWANSVKFPLNAAKIRAYSPPHIADELVTSIQRFPDRMKENLGRIIVRNEGPFPLYHPDFLHSNVIVDEKYNILSVIDWENAGTVPWEMVEFPLFLYTVPPPMDLPSKYDSEGKPVDSKSRQRWEERDEYLQSVKEAERDNSLYDDSLSAMLASWTSQNLATALKLYVDPGKLGFYCRVLDEFH